jgi:hypothetical protein
VACTGEYAVAATGNSNPSIAQVLSKIVTTVNRVDGVYETEVAIRLVLVATETTVVFTNANTDPFNGNNNGGVLIGESQTVITNTIGAANFDIGHTFSTGGGGLAGLGVVCDNSQKASGITGSPSPVGDPYDIDYVAHEIGHQFAGNHTFNSHHAVTPSDSGITKDTSGTPGPKSISEWRWAVHRPSMAFLRSAQRSFSFLIFIPGFLHSQLSVFRTLHLHTRRPMSQHMGFC